jgi:hypothetical protein
MRKPSKPTVAFLTHDWSWGTDPLQPNGCAWYRCKLPSDELNKRGWVSTVGFPGFSKERGFGMLIEGKKAVHGWDLIVFKLLMQKEVLEAIPIAQSLGQTIIVDVDDWFDGLSPANRAFKATDPKANPDSNREIYAQIILAADAVITSTPFLFDYYGKLRDNVFMVRNGIDVQRWKKNQFRSSFAGKKRIRVGWVGATHWRSNDLEQLTPWFGEFVEKNNLTFHHSGHNNEAPKACDLIGVPEKFAKVSHMVPILQYPALFSHMDIGLVPLNNIPFNHAKSFIKGLEYAAAGVPFITSYSPEYEYLVDHGVGRMAHNKDEWLGHLEELMMWDTRVADANKNYDNLQQFSMTARGDDWNATLRFIKDNIRR